MMKALWGSVLLFAAGALCGAETLIDAGKPADFNPKPAQIAADDEGNLIVVSNKEFISKKSIRVDGKKKYRVSFEYKNAEGNSAPAVVQVVAVPYTVTAKKPRRLWSGALNHIAKSETELVSAVEKGADEATFKGTEVWKSALRKKRPYTIAFGAKEGNKDLPNFSYYNVKSMRVDEDGNVVVKFQPKAKLKRAFPAGTRVRLHVHSTMRGVGRTVKAGNDWKTCSFDIQGICKDFSTKKWWRATRTARLLIFGNQTNKANKVLIRNLKLEAL